MKTRSTITETNMGTPLVTEASSYVGKCASYNGTSGHMDHVVTDVIVWRIRTYSASSGFTENDRRAPSAFNVKCTINANI